MTDPSTARSRRVAVVGCKHTTRDFIAGLGRAGVTPDVCVTIAPDKGRAQQVAGYFDLAPFLDERGIERVTVETYSLKSDADRERLLALRLDLLLVMGWQRLIPPWWLERLSVGAFGMHGSFKPLPHGRGRSPMNWALLQGREMFFTHLFQYLPGVDDGPVVGSQRFDLTPYDTCHTTHLKNLVAATQLVARVLPGLLSGAVTPAPQPKGEASYWPKRTEEDGLIYWSDTTRDIHNLVRAVTRPFPGAFTFLDDRAEQKLRVWRAIPFDSHLEWAGSRAGQIVEVFYDGTFVVRTGDTSLLVLESDGHALTSGDVGRRLGHLQRPRKEWPDLPR